MWCHTPRIAKMIPGSYKRRMVQLACEAAWRIYGSEVHYRTPYVERLPFHLKDEQHVIFDATENIDYAIDKSSVNETKFEKTENLDTEKARGPMEWDDLKKVDDVLYPIYRGACYARRLLQDDKEYIDGILEASLWGMGGRTAHSCYAIPINVVKDSMCHIAADSDLADLIRKATLIIWDEAPMINRHCYEAFDRTL
nr:putative PIF1 DNA helicase/replication protein A1-like protein [Tanacetum cinerariifolium]